MQSLIMEDPAERKARLKALKAAAALAEGGAEEDGGAAEEPEPEAAPTLKFRNYAVKDEKNIVFERVRRRVCVSRGLLG